MFPATTFAASIGPRRRARANFSRASSWKTSRSPWQRSSTRRRRCWSGRRRALLDAAREALETWFGAAIGEDRCIRVEADGVTPPALQRKAHRALITASRRKIRFPARRCAPHGAALPRGTALLAIGDWYDLDSAADRDLADLGARFDCTALIARDPWFEGLPLGGIVRMRGAEGGMVRAYVGARERAAFANAVRRREDSLLARFGSANWRSGILREEDGCASLAAAFGAASRVSIDHPARLALGILAVVAFAILYARLQRRVTARDLAYSNVAFFVEAARPRRVDSPWRCRSSGCQRSPASFWEHPVRI